MTDDRKGIVFNIQRFCTNDGPGIRTTVFLKGCLLRCDWCHNPEGLSFSPQVLYFRDRCTLCGKCAAICTTGTRRIMHNGKMAYDPFFCILCGKCADTCPNEALSLYGKAMTVDDVMKVIRRDIPFYNVSGGGATFSGGEPLLQKDFLIRLLLACRQNGIHTAVETALDVPARDMAEVADHTDLFLADIKHMDDAKHRQATGRSNKRILENLQALCRHHPNVVIRVPVIGGFNADPADMADIARFLSGLATIKGVELMPYHGLGTHKLAAMHHAFAQGNHFTPSKEAMAEYKRIFIDSGIPVL